MATVKPREALAYALSREMAILYAVVLTGYLAFLLGGFFWSSAAIRGGGAGVVRQVLAVILFLAGFVGVLGGFIGFIYKVIADANAIARA